jgi:hypothetical protein
MNSWDVSALTDLNGAFFTLSKSSSMFCPAGVLNLNNWDVSRVTSMYGMSQFQVASLIPALDIVPDPI